MIFSPDSDYWESSLTGDVTVSCFIHHDLIIVYIKYNIPPSHTPNSATPNIHHNHPFILQYNSTLKTSSSDQPPSNSHTY